LLNISQGTQILIYNHSDLWAIGVITFFLLCGYTPFEGNNSIEEMNAIMKADYTFDEEYWSGISDPGNVFYY
jgi:serine/threonine protein kinase